MAEQGGKLFRHPRAEVGWRSFRRRDRQRNDCRRQISSLVLAGSIGMVALLSGCTPDIYFNRADLEAYSTLYEKTPEVANVDGDTVDIELPEPMNLSGLVREGRGAEFLGSMASSEVGASVLPLDEALETGVTYGRDYLDEKERVFLAALDLTLARYELAPIGFAGGEVTWATDSRNAAVNNLVSTNTFARSSSAGFNWLYKTGARITADFTRDFLRFTTGNRSLNRSDLAVTILQPILEGGGTTVTMEALTQEERNVLYDLRDFSDFRRFFVVSVVSDYYGVLRARDQVLNSYVAYQGFKKNLEREEALAEEDRRTQTQLGQLRQAALQAESRWINAIRNYQTELDEFKISLGIPVERKLILEDRELDRLSIQPVEITREEAVKIALVTRPDLATTRDQVEDAERQIEVAKNGLLPGLDLTLDYRSRSTPGDTTPGINWDRRRWEGGVALDLPLDRKAQRNIYRSALIFLNQAKRRNELAHEQARLDIFDAWRSLEQARKNFDVANQQVNLATRRLEEQLLLAELGRGEARDLVDAQNDLVNSQNERTSTLIDHTLARLRLWRDMGILYVSEDGSWVKKLRNEPPLAP